MSTFKKNTAVTGFPFGLVDASDGSAITTGTVTVYITKDGGTQATSSNSASHEGNGQWSINLTAGEMNGDLVGILATHTDAVPVHFTIKTDTKLTSELNDLSAANVNDECDTAISDAALATAANLATVDANVDAILVDTGTTLPAQITGLNDPTAADIADAVWDEAISGHTSSGTTGEALDNATAPTAAAVADAVWTEAIADHSGTSGSTAEALNAAGSAGDPWTTTLPGSYTGSQAGKMLSDILTDTAEIGAAGAGLTAIPWNASWDTEVQSEVNDALVAYSASTLDEAAIRTAVGLSSADLDTQIAGLPTATENADALLNRDMDAVSDTNSRTPLNALRFLRNKWSVSGTTLTVTKEDDTAVAWSATLTADASANPVVGSDPA